ncbi:MAG TPA: hypothetical protein VHE12_07250 [bacterium]|nr:hypothetical protein [bacterium]
MPVHKPKNKLDHQGQAAVEYLLILSGVFIAFAGVAVLFSKQVDQFLSILFNMIVLPF